MAEQTQTQQQPRREVSFDSVDPTTLPFELWYKCGKSCAGQVVLGLMNTRDQLTGTGKYTDKQKKPSNEYQETLYPDMVTLTTELVDTYYSTFVKDTTDPVQLQVFGANLNGYRNNGQLNRLITCNGVNFMSTYEFAQLGSLLQLLRNRVEFVATRDASTIRRYQENPEEAKWFEELQSRAQKFTTYLDSVLQRWMVSVNTARTKAKLTGTKLGSDNVSGQRMNTREPREPRDVATPRPRPYYRQSNGGRYGGGGYGGGRYNGGGYGGQYTQPYRGGQQRYRTRRFNNNRDMRTDTTQEQQVSRT